MGKKLSHIRDIVAGGGGAQPFDPTPLQNEDRRLQGEIDATNANVTNIENELQNVAKVNTNNTFTGLQTFELAKVSRTPGAVDDVVNWGLASTKLDEKAFINQANTFVDKQNFPDGISTRFIELTGQGTQDHDVVSHLQLKEQLHINVSNNNNTILGNWKLLTKPLYYYRYNGNVTLNNDQFRITSNVDNIVNFSISLKYNNEHIYLPFTIVAGNVSARLVKDANNGLLVKTTGLPNGSYETAIHLWYNKV